MFITKLYSLFQQYTFLRLNISNNTMKKICPKTQSGADLKLCVRNNLTSLIEGNRYLLIISYFRPTRNIISVSRENYSGKDLPEKSKILILVLSR